MSKGVLRRKPKPPWSRRACCSNKLKRSESLPKTRCCYSQSSTVLGCKRHGIQCGGMRRSRHPVLDACRETKSLWSACDSDIAYVGTSLLLTGDITERKSASTIKRLRFTILPNIAPWRCALARTLGWQPCTGDQKLCGCSDIQRPR